MFEIAGAILAPDVVCQPACRDNVQRVGMWQQRVQLAYVDGYIYSGVIMYEKEVRCKTSLSQQLLLTIPSRTHIPGSLCITRTKVQTPNLDALVKDGVELDRQVCLLEFWRAQFI